MIQRLFELDKLNIAETGKWFILFCQVLDSQRIILAGYKMRTHLAKSLQVRCKTIRRALEQYNDVARAMNPPRPALDWEKISHYSFLEEFTLLQDTRNDIRERKWAKPVIRESIKAYRRLNRAKEEVTWLNCEVVRLHTAIRDEAILFKNALASLATDNPLRGALADFAARRTRTNEHLLQWIHQIYNLPGYSELRRPGQAVHDMNLNATFTSPAPLLSLTTPTADADSEPLRASNGGNDDSSSSDSDRESLDDDEAEDKMGALIQYIAELALL